MEAEILSPLEHLIEIDGRKFVMREMPAVDIQRFIDGLMEISVDDFPLSGAGENVRANNEKIAQASSEEIVSAVNERIKKANDFVSWILGGVEESFVREHITPSIAFRIIEIQNSLNGIDDVIKKLPLRRVREED